MSDLLVVGANSAIAKAFIWEHLNNSNAQGQIHAFSRGQAPDIFKEPIAKKYLTWHTLEYSETHIQLYSEKISQSIPKISTLVLFNGVLHKDNFSPEKSIRQLSSNDFLEVMQINALIPMIWLKHITHYFSRDQDVKIVALSARVGSISDNHLGGWYSYRASKSALNMLLKCYALETARTHPNLSTIIFHPGTTDTPLSKPFQKNVLKAKLFEPEFVAKKLWGIINQTHTGSDIQYKDWDGKDIQW